jgi:signal transduction histidine kinase
LAAGQLLLTPLVSSDLGDVVIYLVGGAGRLAMIALLGYVVLQLVTALRREHEGLLAANRLLAQRAATAEQLAESRERNRLARELHDSVSQTIFSVTLTAQAARLLLDREPARVPELLDRLESMTGGALAQLRSLIAKLHPRQTP